MKKQRKPAVWQGWALAQPDGKRFSQFYANGLPILYRSKREALQDREWQDHRVVRIEIREVKR